MYKPFGDAICVSEETFSKQTDKQSTSRTPRSLPVHAVVDSPSFHMTEKANTEPGLS